jgi:type 1 glutamine amidotransferase
MFARSAAIFAVLAASSLGFAQEPKTKILFLGKDPDHPHGFHMYMHTCSVLAKCVELNPKVEAVVSNGWPKEAKTLDGVKAIILYTDPGAEFLLGGEHRQQADALLEKGVGLMTIHWGSAIRKADVDKLGDAWGKHLGGMWISNVGIEHGKSHLTKLDPEHPIHRGWKEFEVTDEFYLNPTLKEGKPLLKIKDKKGLEQVVGWTTERKDGGRSFGTTLGHHYKNFQDETFRRMIVNGILWTAKVEVPKDGANVAIAKDVLELPPPPKK